MAVRRRSARISSSLISNSEQNLSRRSASSTQINHTSAEKELSPLTDLEVSQDIVKPPRKKKSAKELVPSEYHRNVSNPWKIGAHVSAAGGVENAIVHAAEIGANAFALFLKSQRKWTSADLRTDSISLFKSRMVAFGYDPKFVVPHGSYLINLGNPDREKREKSFECFLDDLRRCEALGLSLYNFHPGSTVGSATSEESIALIADSLNRAHKCTKSVTTVIENMAGSGNVLGSSFSELASIVQKIEDKTRIGICLDTCHMFAAGYDIRTKEAYESTISAFDKEVGLSYLRAMHINDSKTNLGSRRDRHENIGQGFIGIDAFIFIVNDPRLKGIPLILETPSFENPKVWQKEVDILNRLSVASNSSVAQADTREASTDRKGFQNGEKTVTTEEYEKGLLVEEIKAIVAQSSTGKTQGKKITGESKRGVKRKRMKSPDDQDSTKD